MSSRNYRLIIFAAATLLCFAYAELKPKVVDSTNVGLLSTQEIEEQLQVHLPPSYMYLAARR